MHGLRHNRDEALPTHSSRLPLLQKLGILEALRNMRQRAMFKFPFHLNTDLGSLGLSTAVSGGPLKPLVPSVIIGSYEAASKKMYKDELR